MKNIQQSKTKQIRLKAITGSILSLLILNITACSVSTQPLSQTSSELITEILISQQAVKELQGLEQPESVVFDAVNHQYFVSNISGKPNELNGKGFISQLDANGEMLDKYWLTGLNAPKGMAQVDDVLFVADMKQLHIIDISQQKLLQSITVPESEMLNDVTADEEGNVYVSDLLAGGIYKLSTTDVQGSQKVYHLDQWISPDSLSHTNGVVVDGNRLLVATWGQGMHADFSTDVLGGLYEIDLASKHIQPLANAQQFGNLDGLVIIDDNILVNDWINGRLFLYKDSKLTQLKQLEKTAADIAWDGQHLLVPVMMQNKLQMYPVK